MEKDDADCKTLIERTAGTLDNEVLQQLFVSTQQSNLEICMKYAVERTFLQHFDSAETTTSEGYWRIIGTSGAWFPHILVVRMSILVRTRVMLIQVVAHHSQQRVSVSILVQTRVMLIHVVAHCSQLTVSVSILVRATAMLIQVVAHHSQGVISECVDPRSNESHSDPSRCPLFAVNIGECLILHQAQPS
ncbi:uncharacterized protein HD556DRAFT_192451 [Suillus plorans]|uniref:Uncharacterized protein n=1 Tax=Suillus plorans TaxID=116603 RepID=A0A9P7DMK0_9AGAM|nr:uncharacterized protein HD556DRAFT_192451 [Suillus plorans]KAG1798584.1 hypothetical protein HD556DRAFT_192451 [Suillus plorans]